MMEMDSEFGEEYEKEIKKARKKMIFRKMKSKSRTK